MKAIVRTRYGPPDVLRFTEVEKPAPKVNEVLIKLYAASVNPRWSALSRGCAHQNSRSSAVISQGEWKTHVKQFQPGDEVFGVTGFAGGGFAEYACAIENKLALKPANCSFEDAAAVAIAAITALQGLRDNLDPS